MTIIRIGLDTSKYVFQIHGVDENEKPVLRRQLRRSEVERFFAQLPPTRIGIEACGASHHRARRLRGLGHAVLLGRSSSSGSFTERAMVGRAAAPPAPTPIRKGPTLRRRCSASSSSTRIPGEAACLLCP